MKRIYKGTVIGMKKIVRLRRGLNCLGVRLVIRQSRSTPDIAEIGFTNDYAKLRLRGGAYGSKKGTCSDETSPFFFRFIPGHGIRSPRHERRPH